jgi:hypothetical protein
MPIRPELSGTLQWIIGIGQSQEQGGLTLSLLALECYDQGCLLSFLLQAVGQEPVPEAHLLSLRSGYVPLTVTDDLGTTYAFYSQCESLTARGS